MLLDWIFAGACALFVLAILGCIVYIVLSDSGG